MTWSWYPQPFATERILWRHEYSLLFCRHQTTHNILVYSSYFSCWNLKRTQIHPVPIEGPWFTSTTWIGFSAAANANCVSSNKWKKKNDLVAKGPNYLSVFSVILSDNFPITIMVLPKLMFYISCKKLSRFKLDSFNVIQMCFWVGVTIIVALFS